MRNAGHVVVFSHQRSGTHLTMDSVGNNSSCHRDVFTKQGHVTLDHILRRSPFWRPLEDIQRELEIGPRIVKSHSCLPLESFFGESEEVQSFAQMMLRSSHKIYVRRNPLDVLWSQYHYHASWNPDVLAVSFSAYMRQDNEFNREAYVGEMNRADYLAYHVSRWMQQPDVHHVTFEGLVKNHNETVRGILNHIGVASGNCIVNAYQPAWHRILLRLRGMWGVGWLATRLCWRLIPDVARTSVNLWQGRIGEGVRHSTPEDVEFLRKAMGDCFYLP